MSPVYKHRIGGKFMDTPKSASEAEFIPVVTLQAASGWSFPDFKEIWAYRELLYFLVLRDIKLRYRQTIFGGLWASDPAAGYGGGVLARL